MRKAVSRIATICSLLQFSSIAYATDLDSCEPRLAQRQAVASQLADLYQHDLVGDIAPFAEFFRDLGHFVVRAKSPQSIAHKMQAYGLPPEFNHALRGVGDGIGMRLILDDTSLRGIERFTHLLEKAIAEHKLKIVRLENYHGLHISPYLTQAQIQRLILASQQNGQVMDVRTGASSLKPSGYTTLQMNLMLPHGVVGELQIRGHAIQAIAEAEHVLYDIRQGKLGSDETLGQQIQNIFKAWNDQDHAEYSKYIANCYNWGREREIGIRLIPPPIPRFAEGVKALVLCQ